MVRMCAPSDRMIRSTTILPNMVIHALFEVYCIFFLSFLSISVSYCLLLGSSNSRISRANSFESISMLPVTYRAQISKPICWRNRVPFVRRKTNEHSIYSISYSPAPRLNKRKNSFWMISKRMHSCRMAAYQCRAWMIMPNSKPPSRAWILWA